MARLKKSLVILLTFIMIFTLMPVQTKAAKRVKLNKSKLSLKAGNSFTLKLKNAKSKKVKWSSSKKKIATVSKKGKIIAKKKGTCKITAKYKKKKYVCTVTVKNKKPTKPTKSAYTTGSNVPGTLVEYISDRTVEYNSANRIYRVFFSLKLKDGKTRVATSGKVEININNDKSQKVYTNTISFSQSDFGNWTWALTGTKYVCCIEIPIDSIKNGASSKGILDFKVYVNGVSSWWDGDKHSVYNLPIGYDPTVNPKPDPQETYAKNFDSIVSKVKQKGEFSDFGAYCTYGYVSVSMTGDTIEIFENYDRKGHKVTITKGSKKAVATIKLNSGYATAEFDISKFKGDTSDELSWSNNPSQSNQWTYDSAIANVMKNVANYNFYIGGYSFRDIGFVSYKY